MKRLPYHEFSAHESLASLCDDALVLSKDHYSEFRLGAMMIRYATASWQTHDGGRALLKHRSMSFGEHELNKRPASLELYAHPADRIMALTRYSFNVNKSSDIQVFKLVMPVHDAVNGGRLNQKHIKDLHAELRQSHLTEPDTADLQLLFDELSRGASGLHTDDSETLARL